MRWNNIILKNGNQKFVSVCLLESKEYDINIYLLLCLFWKLTVYNCSLLIKSLYKWLPISILGIYPYQNISEIMPKKWYLNSTVTVFFISSEKKIKWSFLISNSYSIFNKHLNNMEHLYFDISKWNELEICHSGENARQKNTRIRKKHNAPISIYLSNLS